MRPFNSHPVGLPVGIPAPEIEGKVFDGNWFKLSDYRGKVVVLDCWVDR
jgi:peroxiredoxin